MKKFTAMLLLSLLLLLSLPMTAMANTENVTNVQENNIMPRMTYIVETKNGLTISGGVATVDCWVNGDATTATKAKVIAELQVKSGNSWIAYGTWTETANAFKASVYETKSVKSGNTYRVKATYTVWEGSQSESTVVFSDEVTA